jgi:hypothetical protein
MAISRRDQQKGVPNGDQACEPCSVMSRMPGLWEFMTACQFIDGSSRTPPTLTFFLEGRLLKACLNDRAEGMVAFATGTSLVSLLEALNEGLEADTLDWRKSQSATKKR